MSNSRSSDADPLVPIADEFMEALRQGKRPSVEEFAGRYPEHAEQIRDMLPALVLMEKAKSAQAPRPDPPPASVAAPLQQLGDYQILREVGRGGMGVVYEAQQLSLGRHVALKVLPSHALLDPRLLGRFEREVRAAARLHHTNIVPVFGVGEQDGLHYYVMQFIHGLGLDEVLEELRRLRQPGGQRPRTRADALGRSTNRTREVSAVEVARGLLSGAFRQVDPASPLTTAEGEPAAGADLPRPPSVPATDSSATIHMPGQSEGDTLTGSGRAYWQSVARIGIQVAEALAHAAGQGILHRDIKPSNLLLDEEGTVWVTDFGLAKADSDADNLTHSGDVIGTLRYLAPECFHGQGNLRSDVYSLGLTLYELLALRPAFDETDRNRLVRQVMHDEPARLRKLNPAVPRDLETVVLKAIARDPEHRYQTPDELAEDLKRFVEDRPIRARRVSEGERFWRWCRRNPLPASLMAAVVLVFLVGFAGVFWQWRLAEAAREDERAQRKDAELARDEASTQAGMARAAEARMAVGLYNSNIVRARLQYRANNVADAEDILDRCEARRRGWEWHFVKQLCHTDLLTLKGHTGWVYAVAYSPDGKLLASAGGGNPYWETQGEASIKPAEVILWDAATGAPLRTLRGHTNVVLALAFSPDGKTLATGSQDDTVRVWEAASGKLLRVLPGRSPRRQVRGSGVSSVAFSPNGKLLAVGSLEKMDVWDLTQTSDASPVPRSTLPGRDGYWTTGMAFSPDGKRLATAYRSVGRGFVKVWDLAGAVEALRLDETVGIMNGVGWSPDGRYLAGWNAADIKFWNAATGKLLKTLGKGREFFAGAFSPTGEQFAAGSNDGVVRIWSVPAGQELHRFRGHRGKVRGVAFGAGGQRLASGSADGTVKVWCLNQDPEHGLIDTSRMDNLEAIAFADQGRRLVAVARGGKVHAFDCETQTRWHSWPAVSLTEQWQTPAEPACLDAEGRWLAGISREDPKVANVWEVATGRERATMRGHQQALLFVTLNPGGTRLATAGRPAPDKAPHSEVKVWDVAEGRPLFELDEPDLLVTRLALSPDGDRLALAGRLVTPREEGRKPWIEPVVRVYHVGSTKVLRAFIGPGAVAGADEPLSALAFSGDGKRLAAAGDARTVLVWDLSAEQPVVTREGPEGAMDLAFSPEGRRLAIVSRLQIKLLDAASGQEVLTLLGRTHLSPDTHSFNPRIRFSPDGQRLVAICHDQRSPVALWSVEKEADRDPAARLRAADRRAIATHLRLARGYAGDPKKRAAFVFHLKQLERVELATEEEYAARGAIYARVGRPEEAEADFARAFELAPQDAGLLYRAGKGFASAGQWDRAAPYFDKYFTRGQGNCASFCQITALPLYLNDRSTYRRYARLLLERYGQSRDREEIFCILYWSLLLSDEGGPPMELLRLADWCLDGGESHSRYKHGWLFLTKGMAEYRAGRYKPAVTWLRKAEPLVFDKAGTGFFLSMAYHRLNQPDQAKASYQKALRHLVRYFGSADRFTPGKGDWWSWPWSQVLRREAEAVLNNAEPPDKPKD